MARVLRDERGQVLIAGAFLVALATLLLVAAVDLGTVHLARARLQAAADAAALAGVQEAEPRFEFEVRPVFRTDFFSVGSVLPEPEQIKSKTPEYVTEYEKHTDPVTGEEVTVEKERLIGWWITYVAGFEKRVVDAWVMLADWPARARAEEAMARNANAWRQIDRMEFVGPWLVDDSVNWSKTRVEYVVNRAVLGVRTQILGRLRGGSDYVFVNVRNQAAEAGFR